MPIKYRWNYTIGWAVEFVRHDAELMLDIDGQRYQKKLGHFTSNEAAEEYAVKCADELGKKVEAMLFDVTAGLPDAKP